MSNNLSISEVYFLNNNLLLKLENNDESGEVVVSKKSFKYVTNHNKGMLDKSDINKIILYEREEAVSISIERVSGSIFVVGNINDNEKKKYVLNSLVLLGYEVKIDKQ